MRLHQFILENMELILGEWVNFARSIQPTKMTTRELRDHAEEMLRTIATAVAKPKTQSQRDDNFKDQPSNTESDTPAEIHADCRLNSGFSIDLLASEYRALRASVLKLWFADNTCSNQEQAEDLIRFNEALDQALAESITRYTESMILSQDIFLGVLGHDLRDPLNSIGAGAQFLLHGAKSDERSLRLGSQMYTSVLRMNKMLDNLLNFTQSRIGGGLKIVHEIADLAEISKHVVQEFHLSHPERVIQNEVIGDCTGSWDIGRLGQAYQNLISNALQYGSLESAIRVVTEDFGDHIIFTVQNDGTPIPLGSQRTIFNLMHRIPHVEEERNMKKNLGLGLYIVREIVTAHHGDISVSSSDEHGTIFRVQLPKHIIAD